MTSAAVSAGTADTALLRRAADDAHGRHRAATAEADAARAAHAAWLADGPPAGEREMDPGESTLNRLHAAELAEEHAAAAVAAATDSLQRAGG